MAAHPSGAQRPGHEKCSRKNARQAHKPHHRRRCRRRRSSSPLARRYMSRGGATYVRLGRRGSRVPSRSCGSAPVPSGRPGAASGPLWICEGRLRSPRLRPPGSRVP
eukprot:364545-Chlamydomonas_euryale.AAC.6